MVPIEGQNKQRSSHPAAFGKGKETRINSYGTEGYVQNQKTPWQKLLVRSGVRTHAHLRVPELKPGALDHSAILTPLMKLEISHVRN